MLIDITKFIHVLIAVSLLGCAVYCFALISSKNFLAKHLSTCYKINKIMLGLVLIAMLLGTLLVIPKHYTFHTAWIQAAYIFAGVLFLALLGLINILKKKKNIIQKRFWQAAYLFLIVILICVIRDAVTKTSFFL